MRGIGGSPADAGGKVVFTGRDPNVRSHFRIATCMAIPAMGAGVSAAAIWREHPQGKYLETVPLVDIVKIGDSNPLPYTEKPTQPLSGIKVLSLTHVIAGTCAARTLAEYGAEVLHVARDQSFEHEILITDANVGMGSTFLDLRQSADHGALASLLPKADVFIESFSGRSIEKLGFGAVEVAAKRPGIIYLSLRCYGWEGPWRDRGGFDMEGVSVSGYTMTESGHGKYWGKTIPAPALTNTIRWAASSR